MTEGMVFVLATATAFVVIVVTVIVCDTVVRVKNG